MSNEKRLLILFSLFAFALGFSLLYACSDEESEPVITDGDTDETNDPIADGDTDAIEDEMGGEDTEEEEAQSGIVPRVETFGRYSVVWLAGSAYEMGYQQGELLHDTIEEAVIFVNNDPLLKSLPSVAKGMGILDIAEENSYEDILEECRGLVDATEDVGFTMDFCLTLNFGDVMLEMVSHGVPEAEKRSGQTPLSLEQIDAFKRLLGGGCTSAAARGEATADGRFYQTRNLDWSGMDISIIHQNPVIFVRHPDDGIPHIYVGFPLNLSPYTGMNAEGIAAGSHEAEPAGQAEMALTGRSHVQMLAQILKHSETLADAKSFIENETHMSAEILVVGDSDDEDAFAFEMTASGMFARAMENDILYATNHFTSETMIDKDAPQNVAIGDSSLLRWERLGQLMPPDGEDSLYGAFDPATMAAVMRDSVNPRTKVEADLSNPENWDNDAGIGSNGAMHMAVFDPANHRIWVAAGKEPVAREPYECFQFTEDFAELVTDTDCQALPYE